MLIKQKKIDNNIFSTLLAKSYNSFTAKIISARVSEIDNIELILNGSIKDLSSPFLFKDIEKAVERLYRHYKIMKLLD